MRNYRSRGFTLIELLVVIAIIGLLASVILASLNSANVKGRDARRLSDFNELQTALELYASDHHGLYPVSTSVGTVAATLTALAPTYIPALPSDPGGNTYYYITTTGGTFYCLGVLMEGTNVPASSCNTNKITAPVSGAGAYNVGP